LQNQCELPETMFRALPIRPPLTAASIMTDELLKKIVLQTIAYFHLFKIPLTASEIRKNLFQPPCSWTFHEVETAASEMDGKILGSREGFYFFKGNDEFVEIRKTRYLISDRLIKQNRPFIGLLSRIPFVRAIFICNTLSCQNATDMSDVDLAIVCAKGRIWLVRFAAAALMKLLMKRPKAENTRNKICLSFFVSEADLNLQPLAYDEDIHFIYWLNQFMPIFDPTDFNAKLRTANSWTEEFLPNNHSNDTCKRWRVQFSSKTKRVLEKLLVGTLGNSVEAVLKRLQLKIMPAPLKKQAAKNNSNVVLSDEVLKFHDKDKRLYYRDNWKTLCQRLIDPTQI